MFLVKAGTVIQIEPKKSENFHRNWTPYTTKEDKLYDKEEVWGMVSVHNEQEEIPYWAISNIRNHGVTVLRKAGKYALVGNSHITYLD